MRKIFIFMTGLFLFALVNSGSAQLDPFLGKWVNIDPQTRGVTRLEINTTSEGVTVQAWAACTPECDWGVSPAIAYAPNVSTLVEEGAEALIAISTTDFNEKIMVLKMLESGNLELEVFTRFTDDSQRSAYVNRYEFVHEDSFSAIPRQISPQNGSVFNNYPRTTTLAWAQVDGAASYSVEIDCFHCCQNNAWCTDVGAQPGRWRVWAVDGEGNEGQKSGWWEFTYTQ